ncbi:terbinafine resistance locus protein Yip1 [Babesia caballi]|uniref:Terbinafine resistance locus protein Yip1 n=1 Tax=Babesia caballi TaxID=5871 RepID=A0AAV4LSB3_BABCB|nr:terbinafine resistance locus protein Yip1 [Babesia caballi]
MFSGDVQDAATTRLFKDLSTVGNKLLYVLGKSCYVNKGEELLKWDLFGPLFISLLFPLIVYFPSSSRNPEAQGLAFALFFAYLFLPFFPRAILVTVTVTYALLNVRKTLEGHMVKDKWIMAYQPILFMYITSGVLIVFNE